jgi:hypothetical protein
MEANNPELFHTWKALDFYTYIPYSHIRICPFFSLVTYLLGSL